MEIAVFAKRCTGKDGKAFTRYLSTLTKKDGTRQTVAVKFREACGSPKAEECPMNINVERRDINLSSREFEREDTGEVGTAFTLWVSAWKQGTPYIDTSLDEYDI